MGLQISRSHCRDLWIEADYGLVISLSKDALQRKPAYYDLRAVEAIRSWIKGPDPYNQKGIPRFNLDRPYKMQQPTTHLPKPDAQMAGGEPRHSAAIAVDPKPQPYARTPIRKMLIRVEVKMSLGEGTSPWMKAPGNADHGDLRSGSVWRGLVRNPARSGR